MCLGQKVTRGESNCNRPFEELEGNQGADTREVGELLGWRNADAAHDRQVQDEVFGFAQPFEGGPRCCRS